MKQKIWGLLLIITLLLQPFSHLAYANNGSYPVSEIHSASSDPFEPIISIGPAGETLITNDETIQIGPGIELTAFERFDARGWLNGEVLKVDFRNDQVYGDLLFPGTISSTLPLSEMARSANAIAGVNGDFFDINNSKAPLGAMIQGGSILKSPQGSHQLVAGMNENGQGQISKVFLEGKIILPEGEISLDALNQYSIPENGIGLYTSAWGSFQRPAAGSPVYEITVKDGKVYSTSEQTGSGEIPENTYILIGRESGAANLKDLKIGDPVSVEYFPKFDSESLMKFAIGGNIKLIDDGEIPSNLDDSVTAPRTAVGFSEDGQTMYLAVVDGRQTNSRGMTIKEIASFMKEIGAYQSLNLDGGGSSTIVARLPGNESAEVMNNPSDGFERSVPNGIGIFVKEGSGQLYGFEIKTKSSLPNSNRVFPGLSRSFIGLGYDENYYPVETGQISWQALPSDIGTFDSNGVFYAKKSGTAVAEAQIKSRKGTADLIVLGQLDRIEASESYIGMEMGRSTNFSVFGYDKNGYSAPIEPKDVELSYNSEVIQITESGDGSYTVIPKQNDSSTVITIKVLNKQYNLPVTVGLSTVSISEFETADGWTFTKYPAVVGASMELTDGRNGNGIQLNYDFSTTTATRAAYLQASPRIGLPGDVQKIGLWVKGDGNGAWLRTVITDASGTNYTLTLADQVNWTGWKYVETSLPEGISYPVQLYRIYPVETNRSEQYTGQLVFDDLTVKVPPAVEIPEQEDVSTDPIIVQNSQISNDRWKFAVISDSQFVGSSQDSLQANMARKALREIVAENPEFIVINGDLVDTAWEQDFEFAKRLLEEEVGDSIPIYYIPGNHEIAGPGSLTNFLNVFGENRYSFDHNGTRFILLDSSTGSFRTSDFQQLIDLRMSLDDAKSDPSVNNVVVIGHHPTRDPLPTANSQLSDKKEAEMLENWLTDFRSESGGKGAIYLSGHAHMVHIERVEGVPYMVLGSAGKAPYSSPDDGGFYAWTLFGIDPTPIPEQSFGPDKSSKQSKINDAQWISAEIRPILDSITLNAPESMNVNEEVLLQATGHQPGNLDIPLSYPATVEWNGSENVFIGSGEKLEHAKQFGQYTAVFNTDSNQLIALKPGEITISVTSNNMTAEKQILIH